MSLSATVYSHAIFWHKRNAVTARIAMSCDSFFGKKDTRGQKCAGYTGAATE
jgi:G:T-mismatch repair DNA endonuclease (very short patch repair protein)